MGATASHATTAVVASACSEGISQNVLPTDSNKLQTTLVKEISLNMNYKQ